MEPGQSFCFTRTNHLSKLPHDIYKQWVAGLNVDVTLIVEGRHLDCHKMVLSACSSYFERILQEHSTHQDDNHHLFIPLSDLPFHAVESIVRFMYQGKINVSLEQVADQLKVADALKVKDFSHAINSFSECHLLQSFCLLQRAKQFPSVNGNVNYPNPSEGYPQRVDSAKPTKKKYKKNVPVGSQSFNKLNEVPGGSRVVKRQQKKIPCQDAGYPQRVDSVKPTKYKNVPVGCQRFNKLNEVPGGSRVVKGQRKKIPCQDYASYNNLPTTLPNSLPLTPTAPLNDTSINESQPSPMAQSIPEVFTLKQEAECEMDVKLQIDESAAPYPADPDSCPASRGPENEMRDQNEENKPHPGVLIPISESNLLNPLHPCTVPAFPSQQGVCGDMKNIKTEKPNDSIAARNPATPVLTIPKNIVMTSQKLQSLENMWQYEMRRGLHRIEQIKHIVLSSDTPGNVNLDTLIALKGFQEFDMRRDLQLIQQIIFSSDTPGNVNLDALTDAQNHTFSHI